MRVLHLERKQYTDLVLGKSQVCVLHVFLQLCMQVLVLWGLRHKPQVQVFLLSNNPYNVLQLSKPANQRFCLESSSLVLALPLDF